LKHITFILVRRGIKYQVMVFAASSNHRYICNQYMSLERCATMTSAQGGM